MTDYIRPSQHWKRTWLVGVTAAASLLAQGQAPSSPTIDGPPAPVAPEVITRTSTGQATVRAIRLTAPLKVDGRLDETAWSLATPVSAFTQRDPNAGAPPTERTEVRFLFDGDAVYVGARLHDSSGRVSTRLGRGGGVVGDFLS